MRSRYVPLILVLWFAALVGSARVQAAPAVPAAPSISAEGHPACAGVTYQTPQTPECDAVMAAQPYPDVTAIPYDLGVIAGKSFIYFDADEVPLYDAPDGEEVEVFTAGRSSYVNVLQTSGDWAEIRPGRWASLDKAHFAEPSTLTGVIINRMEMPFAWAIYDFCTSLIPGGPRSCQQSGSFRRYDLMNIYATVHVGEWDWHLVGPQQWAVQTKLSIVHPTPPANFGGRWIGVSTYEQNLVAYEGARPAMAALVSTGNMEEDKWRTDPGTWKVDLFWEVGPMEGAAGSDAFYSLDQVPYHMYFNWREALHGVYWHDNFGYYWSHGCVNLTVSDAKWLWDHWVVLGTRVYVYDEKLG